MEKAKREQEKAEKAKKAQEEAASGDAFDINMCDDVGSKPVPKKKKKKKGPPPGFLERQKERAAATEAPPPPPEEEVKEEAPPQVDEAPKERVRVESKNPNMKEDDFVSA